MEYVGVMLVRVRCVATRHAYRFHTGRAGGRQHDVSACVRAARRNTTMLLMSPLIQEHYNTFGYKV